MLPTAAGKSLVYQLTAQLLPGLTIVVSPLIALMKDQAESIEGHGLEVAVVNSTQSEGESADELRQARRGGAKLLYVTPERFADEHFMAQMRRAHVSLLAVDAAHCLAEWGHDFRPSYLVLGSVAAELGRPTLLALTATATPWVRREIVERLGMHDPDLVVQGSDRPNLFFEVHRVEAEAEEYRVLERLLTDDGFEYPPEMAHALGEAMQGSGIIYTATTRAAEETAEWLHGWGIAADYYHGQRKSADRDRAQAGFMDGTVRVIAATNAFGLGVDKPDVRFVIHRDVPSNVEAYYQEAGRAGRDGRLARCSMIYRPGALGRAAFLAGGGQLTQEKVERGRYALLRRREGTPRELQPLTDLSKADLLRLIGILKRDGILEERRGKIRMLVPDFDPTQVSLEREEHRRAYERSRSEMMRAYAELPECRREYLLNYFGEELTTGRCNRCDNDLTRRGGRQADVPRVGVGEAPFEMNERVVHQAWGEGMIQRVTDETVTVLFETVGYKTLETEIVRERGLLRKTA